MSIVPRKIHESAKAMAAVFRSKNLRRIQLAWIGSIIGSWAYSVALVVCAYNEGGRRAPASRILPPHFGRGRARWAFN